MDDAFSKYRSVLINDSGVVVAHAGPVALSLLAGFFLWVFTTLYKRHKFYSKLPGPPHSFFFGHVRSIAECMQVIPKDSHPQLLMSEICRRHKLWEPGVFYLNFFPVRLEPMIIVTEADYAAQVTQVPGGGPPKHPGMEIIKPFTGKYGIVMMEGNEHKKMRAVFNPGFSTRNLMELVPAMVDEAVIFSECLAVAAESGKPVPIDNLATKATFDVMARVVFGESFNSQKGDSRMVNEFLAVFRAQGQTPTSPMDMSNLLIFPVIKRRVLIWYHGRILNKLIREAVIKRIERARAEAREQEKKTAANGNSGDAKLIVDLALKEYLSMGTEIGGKKGKNSNGVDEMFLQVAADNIKTFLFAGHDTTSSTITFSLYLLSEHPGILKQLRQEHDEILGTDLTAAAAKIRSDPSIVNQLTLTQAVIKETLRLYPPASTVRSGTPDMQLRNLTTGDLYPTQDHLLWVLNHCVSRDPKYFPSPSHFMPARFLPTPPTGFPQIPANAFRPFEKGTRNCIGQELALLEARIMLAMAVRRFDFEAAFGKGKGGWKREVDEEDGVVRYPEGAYQVLVMTAKPKDGLMMKVSIV